eukprot:jgi/Mesvir1/4084/Mv08617-RA.1
MAEKIRAMQDIFGSDDSDQEENDERTADQGQTATSSESGKENESDDEEEDVDRKLKRVEKGGPSKSREDLEQGAGEGVEDDIESDMSGSQGGDDREPSSSQKRVGPPVEIHVPLCPPPGSRDGKLHYVKLSNILDIAPVEFDPDSYVPEEEEFMDESGELRVRLCTENMIRWRFQTDETTGEKKRVSNARFVRWSDGSLQLLLGDEVFDVLQQDVRLDNSFLFVRHHGGVLQGQGPITSKMVFRPTSLSSKSHRQLTAKLDTRHAPVNKVKKTFTFFDPEKEKEEKEEMEERRIREKEELLKQQDKAGKKYKLPQRGPARGVGGLSSRFLEEEDDADEGMDEEQEAEAAERILEAKTASAPNPVKQARATPATKPSKVPARRADSMSEESSEEEDDDDDEPARYNDARKPTPAGGAKRKGVAIEDDEEEGEAQAGRKKGRRNLILDDEDDDV